MEESRTLTQECIDQACLSLSSEIQFGANRMASQEYRTAVSGGLLKAALVQIQEDHENLS